MPTQHKHSAHIRSAAQTNSLGYERTKTQQFSNTQRTNLQPQKPQKLKNLPTQQLTNTSTHQLTNSKNHKLINSPTHQHINTSTHELTNLQTQKLKTLLFILQHRTIIHSVLAQIWVKK